MRDLRCDDGILQQGSDERKLIFLSCEVVYVTVNLCVFVEQMNIILSLIFQITPERLKARQLAKAKAFEAEMKKQTQAMNSLVIGCIWWNPHTSGAQADPNYGKLVEFAVC